MAFTDKFASLTELNIARTKISEKGLHHIVKYAPRLKKLCLRSLDLGDISMLTGLQHLIELDIGNPRWLNTPTTEFPVIPSLRSLLIPKFSTKYDLIRAFKEMPNLTELDISEASIEVMQSINHLRLKSLTLKPLQPHNLMTGDIQDTIKAVGCSLTYLDMSGGKGSRVWAQMILYAVENCPNLEKLIINDCYSITSHAPKLIELIYDHPHINYVEGCSYTFDPPGLSNPGRDQDQIKRLRKKPGFLKILTDGIL